jgi:hypothetical protein
MPNRNSQTGEYSPVVNEETKRKEEDARNQREQAKSYKEIGGNLGVSTSRAAEYCKNPTKD